jgi:exonuclease III
MRFAAWNVAHQIRQRVFPTEVLRVFLSLQPDVVVLTEYVPGPDHERVLADFATAGFAGTHLSERVERQNQVLVATRSSSERGAWQAPAIRPQVPPNFLHVFIPAEELDVVGLRIPMFVSGDTAAERAYRGWLREQADNWGGRQSVVLGDLNTGPHRARSWQWRSLESFTERGWSLHTPAEGWSYMSKTGHMSRIDHALLSPALTATDARYVTEVGGMVLAGRHPPAPSDHAVLVIDADLDAVSNEKGAAS